MTSLFLMSLHPDVCKICDATRKTGRKYCTKHLKIYARKFREWCTARKAQGLCIHCLSTACSGQLRCEPHRQHNANRCRVWSQNKRDQNRSTGVCWKHKETIIPGTAWCGNCREEQRANQRQRRANRSFAKRTS